MAFVGRRPRANTNFIQEALMKYRFLGSSGLQVSRISLGNVSLINFVYARRTFAVISKMSPWLCNSESADRK